jgi:hypothetical protein
LPRRATSPGEFYFSIKKLLTNALKWCFFPPVKNENYGHFNSEAFASQWMHVYWAAQVFWSGHRGNGILNKITDFSENPAIASQSRGFRFLTQNQQTK